jgi:hypothetical protein
MHLAYPGIASSASTTTRNPHASCSAISDQRCDINSADERFWRENEWDTGAWVHPPLGKWMIAFGELAFGTESMGWRVGAAAPDRDGDASGRHHPAAVRQPHLDVHGRPAAGRASTSCSRDRNARHLLAFWVVLVFVFLLLDRRWIESRTPRPPRTPGAEAPRSGSLCRLSGARTVRRRARRHAMATVVGLTAFVTAIAVL